MNMSKGKVLIAENEERIRKLLNIYLEKNEYLVVEAKDGEEVLQLLNKMKPDVLVLDILMPKLTGIEVCKIVRKDPRSEERRVGKECRSRWGRYQYKKRE